MSQNVYKTIYNIVLGSVFCGFAFSQTLVFDADKGFSDFSQKADSQLLSKIAEFKSLVSQNKASQAKSSADELMANYPGLAKEGFADFVSSEIYYAKRNYLKAGKEYDNFLDNYPNSSLYEAALERQYDIAVAFLQGQKVRKLIFLRLSAYEEAAKMLENIADRTGDAAIAKRALFTLAENFERRKKFLDAYQVWSDISSRWATGETGKLALFGMARSLHSSYRGPKFTATNIDSAKSYLTTFAERYPQDAQELGVLASLELIEQQKAFKNYETAKYYVRVENVPSAEIYYDSVIENWQDSAAAQLSKKELRKLKAEGIVKKKNIFIDWWFNPPADKIALFNI